MATLIQHAERELNLLLEKCKKDQDDKSAIEMQELMNNQVLDVIKIISDQEHSGFSIGYFLNILTRLIKYKPILPLTGEDDEWQQTVLGQKQNKRCCSVFENEDGTITDIERVMYSDNGGHTWYNGSNKFGKLATIKMPYYPSTEPIKKYIEYKEDGSWEDITDDKDRIKALYDKYVYYCEEAK